MRKNFYLKLALGNIRKNGKFYLPFLLTCIAAAAMFFNMCSIYTNETLTSRQDAQMILGLGVIVIALFSAIFLFYTNSFLIKRRKKELALYNIFGMEKRHIGRMLVWEKVVTAVISIGGGLLTGILFDRLMFLILLKTLHLEQVKYHLSSRPVLMTLALFTVIFLLILITDIARIQRSRPAELLQGASAGEREPKSRKILAVAGAVSLAAGYGLALGSKGIYAFLMFFVAVIFVIIGTYCLFTAGSVAILKGVKKRENYYYKPNHFISVSGMIYRMKQNAVGLANICVLSTVVLVMLSSTVSLYVGVSDIVKQNYPYDISGAYPEGGQVEAAEEMNRIASEMNLEIENYSSYETLSVTFVKDGTAFERSDLDNASMNNVAVLIFMDSHSYLNLTGQKTDLAQDEVLVWNSSSVKKKSRLEAGDILDILGTKLRVKDTADESPMPGRTSYPVDDVYYIVLSDESMMERIDRLQRDLYEEHYSVVNRIFQFDLSGTDDQEKAFYNEVSANISQARKAAGEGGGNSADMSRYDYPATTVSSRADSVNWVYGLYGSFLFIGLFLGLLFIFATVLIIYYKQIIEGYEDKERFEIMKKVGLSNTEIRSAVKSQILTMFFLPLAAAVIHTVFAFPMVKIILGMMGLSDVSVFIVCTAAVVCVFAVCYAAVYALTAKAYYKIVS